MNIFYPLKIFADWLTYDIFQITPETSPVEAVNFFIFDTVKIFLLLAFIIFLISIIRSFLPPEKIKQTLSHKNQYVGNILAAIFGIFAPFCT